MLDIPIVLGNRKRFKLKYFSGVFSPTKLLKSHFFYKLWFISPDDIVKQ